ncbi:MAG: hypothetical protein K1V95_06195 [Eubacterium sp.]
MPEENKIKSSLFGYSKKAVDEAIEKISKENNQKISELNAKIIQNQKSSAMLEMEIKMLHECNSELEAQLNDMKSNIEATVCENAELKKANEEQKQRVDEALAELEKAKSVISEKEIVISSIKSQRDQLDSDYTDILNTFNNLKADITRSRIIIDEKDKQIEMLNSKLGKYQIRHNEIMLKSDEISRSIIHSGSEFDKKISDLRECTNQMKLLIAEAEYAFNETSMHVSNFISVASGDNEPPKPENSTPKTTTEIHIS